jgi:hypothetical protein
MQRRHEGVKAFDMCRLTYISDRMWSRMRMPIVDGCGLHLQTDHMGAVQMPMQREGGDECAARRGKS